MFVRITWLIRAPNEVPVLPFGSSRLLRFSEVLFTATGFLAKPNVTEDTDFVFFRERNSEAKTNTVVRGFQHGLTIFARGTRLRLPENTLKTSGYSRQAFVGNRKCAEILVPLELSVSCKLVQLQAAVPAAGLHEPLRQADPRTVPAARAECLQENSAMVLSDTIFCGGRSRLCDTVRNPDAPSSRKGHFAAADYWYGSCPTITVATTAPTESAC